MYFLCDKIGDGSDAEGNELRPALADHPGVGAWSAADVPTRALMVVRCAHQPSFDADTRIRPLRKALLANLAPDDGETDDADDPDLARKFIRRAVVNQLLRGDDFGGDLDLVVVAGARLQRIRQRLSDRGYDISGVVAGATVREALRSILPQIKVRLEPSAVAPSGTFTDGFNKTGPDQDLADYSASWTRVDGSADMAQVSGSKDWLISNTTDGNGALYQCPDQGSADQYVQYVIKNANFTSYICNRATDRANYIGVRSFQNVVRIFKRDAGSFTQLAIGGSTNADDILRLESSGDSHEAFLNDVSVAGPVTDAFNNTETRQGCNPRNQTGDWADDFEAGTLGAGGATLVAADAAHAHAADTVALTQAHLLAGLDALHAHAADQPGLAEAHALSVLDALDGHSADAVALGQVHALTAAVALHPHAAETAVLDAGLILAIADALHAQPADAAGLGQVHALATADSVHAHVAGLATFLELHGLTVADALHAHAAGQVALSLEQLLAILRALHGHTAEAANLAAVHALAVAKALHAQGAGATALAQIHGLIAAAADHGQAVDIVSIAAGLLAAGPGRLTLADLARGRVALADRARGAVALDEGARGGITLSDLPH